MSQTYLHIDNFELCRICLRDPEENRNVKFTNIFPDDDAEDSTLQQQIEEIYGIKIENDAFKPKIICKICEDELYSWVEMKKRSAEPAIVIDYLAKSKSTPPTTSNARSNSSLNSNNEEKPTMVQLEKNKTELPIEKKNNEIKFKCKTRNKRNTKLPSTYKIFTCLKPSCNIIFQTFSTFKLHHRKHFGYGDKVICWLCCAPFSSKSELKIHQMTTECFTPDKFKCYECSQEFNDLEDLGIHKFTIHNSDLISRKKKSKKTIKCAHCQKGIVIYNFKEHLQKFH